MITQSGFVTIECDAPECSNNVTFPADKEGEVKATIDNPWIHTMRTVATQDKRQLTYCSDECEIRGAATGAHNKIEPRRVSGNTNVNLAAQAAHRAQLATAALKAGAQVSLS